MPIEDDVSAVRANHRFDEARLERYLSGRMANFRGPLEVMGWTQPPLSKRPR